MQQLVHGVVDELLARIEQLGGLNAPQDGLQGRIRVRSYDVAAYKCAADGCCKVPVCICCCTLWRWPCCRTRHGHHAVIVETKSGRQALARLAGHRLFGDADIAHLAGVPFELGDGAGDALYPSTMFRIGQVDASACAGSHRRASRPSTC
jgi:hypothetical protein